MKYFFGTILMMLVLPSAAFAASITLIPQASPLTEQRFFVDVFVDTGGMSINSISLTLEHSAGTIFKGYSNAESSVPIWVQEPAEKKSGVVTFAGVIPGGIDRTYDPNNTLKQSIRITRLYFEKQAPGTTTFTLHDIQVLKNDGKGTALPVEDSTLVVAVAEGSTISSEKSESMSEDKSDAIPPVPFVVTVLPESFFGHTPRLLSFAAEDSESGIHHYEVRIGDGQFAIALSPYPLPYRLFSFTATVRAFDFSGNYREQSITVPGDSPLPLGLTLLAVLVGMVFYRYLRRRRSSS